MGASDEGAGDDDAATAEPDEPVPVSLVPPITPVDSPPFAPAVPVDPAVPDALDDVAAPIEPEDASEPTGPEEATAPLAPDSADTAERDVAVAPEAVGPGEAVTAAAAVDPPLVGMPPTAPLDATVAPLPEPLLAAAGPGMSADSVVACGAGGALAGGVDDATALLAGAVTEGATAGSAVGAAVAAPGDADAAAVPATVGDGAEDAAAGAAAVAGGAAGVGEAADCAADVPAAAPAWFSATALGGGVAPLGRSTTKFTSAREATLLPPGSSTSMRMVWAWWTSTLAASTSHRPPAATVSATNLSST